MDADKALNLNGTGHLPKHRRMVAAALLTGTLLAVLAVVVVWRRSSQNTLEHARAISISDPSRALLVVEASLQRAEQPTADWMLLKCELQAALGHEPDAIVTFNSIVNPSGQDAAALVGTAKAVQAKGAKQLAEKLLLAANHPGPLCQDVLRSLIELDYEREEYKSVLDYCQELAKMAPGDSMPWLVSAGIHHENEHVTKALYDYRQALKRDLPGSEITRVRYHIADLSLFIGDLTAARQEVNLLLAAQATSLDVSLLNARLLRNEGKLQQALDVVNKILRKHRNQSRALLLRGEVQLDMNEFAEAAIDLEQVVRADPFNYQAHYLLAKAYIRSGKPESAQDHLATSRQLTNIIREIQRLLYEVSQDPTNEQLRLRLAELHQQRGDYQTAEYWRSSARKLP